MFLTLLAVGAAFRWKQKHDLLEKQFQEYRAEQSTNYHHLSPGYYRVEWVEIKTNSSWTIWGSVRVDHSAPLVTLWVQDRTNLIDGRVEMRQVFTR